MENKISYHSVNRWLQNRYGCKVYKIAIDAGCTCPNRDGTLDTRGCIFCSSGGSGEFTCGGRHADRNLTVNEQIELGKELVKGKIKERPAKYIAYFQAFTNTYGDPLKLKAKYVEAAENDDICIVSIATRPDCLSEEILSILSEINQRKPVWVELGLQTIHPLTAEYIRRGYPLEVFDSAVKELNDLGISVIVHVILGLPGETEEMMLQTVDYACKSGISGIKLQLLHVLKGTDLEREYLGGMFQCLTLEEYAGIVADCLKIIPENVIVHRLTGDGDKRILIAPEWSGDKKRVLNYLHRYIEEK